MSDVDDLVIWLRAQLDDDERVAHEAGTTGPEGGELFVIDDDYRHDTVAIPATRVLAEVDAKRRILDLFEYEQVDVSLPWGPPTTVPGKRPATAGPLLRLLALPYADRPGYRDEWRV